MTEPKMTLSEIDNEFDLLEQCPDYPYKDMASALNWYGDCDFDYNKWTDEQRAFTDDMTQWSFAFFSYEGSDPDYPTQFLLSPTSLWATDRPWPDTFVDKVLQPRFPKNIAQSMEACYEVDLPKEKIRAILTAIGINEKPEELW